MVVKHYLDITIDDQNYQVNTNIAFRFMYYELASKQRPHVNRQDFSYWFWFVFPDDKTLTGRASGNVKDPNADHEKEYWTIELRKTSSKGLFVWKWYENNFNPL